MSVFPTTAQDWQLYAMPLSSVAATSLTVALSEAKKSLTHEAQDVELDADEVRGLISRVYNTHLVPVMDQFSEFGASDSEPRSIAIGELQACAAEIYEVDPSVFEW